MAMTSEHLHLIATRYTEAWNTGRPDSVAAFFSPDGTISINGADGWRGRDGVANMAAGFYGDVPDLQLVCDGVRGSGNHAVYLWTFTGTHAVSGRGLRVSGWEEWDLDDAGLIERSFGNFDQD